RSPPPRPSRRWRPACGSPDGANSFLTCSEDALFTCAEDAAVTCSEEVEQGAEIRRQRRVELEPLAGHGMVEGEARRVQELPPEPLVGDAVDGVADDGQADRGEVD